jgi:hypothetical protein
MLKFFRGCKIGNLITTNKYEDKFECPSFSSNFKLEQSIIGVIIKRKWHWFGIINRTCESDSYDYYDINEYLQDFEISWVMKRWGWEYQILIEGELKYLWHGEFLVIN